MSIIGSNILAGASGQGGAYEIEQSLRFNSADSANLSRTPGSTGNRKTWTWSGWVKRNKLGAWHTLFSAGNSSPSQRGGIRLNSSDQLTVEEDSGGYALISTQVFRDVSAWYHLVIAFDSTQATSTDRIKVYVNGSQITNFSTTTYPSQNFDSIINTTDPHRIGELSYAGNIYELDGYLAEVNFIDGSALNATDFGEFDDNGVWRPVRYAGSYTGNSFYLKFASGDGTDDSGLSNTWTANNFTTSGTGTDVMSDTPTTNYCTWNPITTNSSGVLLSDGNLFAAHAGSNDYGVIGTIGVTSGKWYWEGQLKNFVGFRHLVGVTHSVEAGNPNLIDKSLDTGFWGSRIVNGSTFYILENGSQVNTSASYPGSTPSSDSIMQFALDLDNLKWYIGFDGNWYNSGNPAAGTNATSTGLTSGQTWFPICELRGDEDSLWNFGQRAFAYTPPTGFKALNTSNLPAPDIAKGSDYFNTVAWTGTGASRTIDFGMQPDWIWAKGRNTAANHRMSDNVRGGDGTTFYNLTTNATNAENTDTVINGITSTGVTFKNVNDHPNSSGSTYVGWGWKANGSGSSISAGSIDGTNPTIASTVSANPTAGFSIVSYTGTGSTATVGHGLGVAPSMIIFKNRDDGGTYDYWSVYHSAYSPSSVLYLNTTDGLGSATAFFDTAPTSTVFQVKTENKVNGLNDKHIAYCFAEVEGYSKFGSYSGGDGVFVYLGFRPSLLILKGTVGTRNWVILDSERSTYNVVDDIIHPNLNLAESVQGSSSVDFLSNGFVTRGGNISGSGDLTVFAAFAENPFGGEGVSPATAR